MKYIVEISKTCYANVEVEANTEEEARTKAEEMKDKAVLVWRDKFRS